MSNFNTMFPSFPNYTKEMYLGNEPCGKGWEQPDGTFCDRWDFCYGGAQTHGDEVVSARFNIDKKIIVHIAGNDLWITDLRHSGKPDVWEYTTDGSFKTIVHSAYRHQLEPDRIEKILNSKIECKIWRMIQAKAKEIYNRNQS